MQYFIEVTIYTAAMLLVYVLFLRNRPLYNFSRFYLLASAALPFLMPLIELPVLLGQKIQMLPLLQFDLPEIAVGAAGNLKQSIDSSQMLLLVYVAVAIAGIILQLRNACMLWRTIKKSEKTRHGAFTLITSSGQGPGSFGRYVFFPGPEVDKTILAHEQAHVTLHHSGDIVFLNLLQAITWPNVLLIWIKKEIREVHEFQADSMVDSDREAYIQLLLCSAFQVSSMPLLHSFIIHPIKRRIMMLQKKGKASVIKASVLVTASTCVFLTVGMVIQSCNKNSGKTTSSSATTVTADVANKPDINGVYKMAATMPTCAYNWQSFLAENIKYPEDAKKKGVEGRVVIKFIVDENGNLVHPEVLKSPDDNLSAEALRVVSMMPKWVPGEENGKKVPVYFVLPISFKLS
jgi:TonB family protein